MTTVLLDTTVLIDVIRGRPVVARLDAARRAGARVLTSAINVEELVRGLRPSEQHVSDDLFGRLRVIPIDRAVADRAGRWRRGFAGQGVTLSQSDCLVAAAAVSVGASLATGNVNHFPMPELAVEDWPVGE